MIAKRISRGRVARNLFAIFAAILTAISGQSSVVASSLLPGTLDASFNPTGTQPGVETTTIAVTTKAAPSIKSIAIDSEGRIVAGGFSDDGTRNFTIARYNKNGSLDSTFGLGGIKTSTIGSNSSINSIAIDSEGKIVAGGSSYDGTRDNFTLARYNKNGSLDSTFGSDGVKISTIGSGRSGINSIAFNCSGKILAGGSSSDGIQNFFTLARYIGVPGNRSAAEDSFCPKK